MITPNSIILTKGRIKFVYDLTKNDELYNGTTWIKLKHNIEYQTTSKFIITMIDGTKLHSSSDHLWMTKTGWKTTRKLTIHDELMNVDLVDFKSCYIKIQYISISDLSEMVKLNSVSVINGFLSADDERIPSTPI